MQLSTVNIFALVAFVYLFFVVKEYFRLGKKLSMAGKIWLGVSLVFMVVAICLSLRTL